jgi:xanthine dehydrogenase accessory factor
MAFTDAVFDGVASLEGVQAVRIDDLSTLEAKLGVHVAVPVCVQSFEGVLAVVLPVILIDARMRKRARPESQLGLAPLTIGLGPNFVAGKTTDLIVETAWGDDLGKVYDQGSTKPLEGEPQELAGHARERFVYAPVGGRFHSPLSIGDIVDEDEEIASIDGSRLLAPLAGMLRALTRNDVSVTTGTKVIEIDGRGAEAPSPAGIGHRPAKIADGILNAVRGRRLAKLSACNPLEGRITR